MAIPPDWTSPAMQEAFERAFKEACKSGISNILISSGNLDRPPTATEGLREMLTQGEPRVRHIRAVWNGNGPPTIEAMVMCQYCDQPAERVDGAHLYPHYPDLAYRMYYRCQPCGAWVGTHERDNETPYGELANGQLRRLRILAHDAFDNYWPLVVRTRNQGYAWLAERMDLPERECHIGGFGINECQEVIDMCTDTYEHFDDFEDLTINRDVEDLLE